MDTSLIVAYVAAFLSLALLVLLIAGMAQRLLGRHNRSWVRTKRERPTWISASTDFVKGLLFAEALKFESVEKLRAKLAVDVVRANSELTGDQYLAKSLFEGAIVLVVGSVICLALFGPWSLLLPVLLATIWVFWVSPALVEGDGEKRSRSVYRRIPYALDLAVLTLQAGGTLRDGLVVAATGDDPLAEELRTAMKEMDSGASQSAALTNLSNRVGVPALDSIVLAINRGQETGAPMVQTLSTQAELFRERRLQELEKLAVEAPTKMTFPNMMVMLSVLVIVIGPVLVKIATSGML